VATGNALISGGVGVAPSWGKIGLTTHVSGTLGVGNGGTGTATAFTAGSIVFAGASGVYSQKNANLFWDNTNNFLGIGTATPSYPIDLQLSKTLTTTSGDGQLAISNPSATTSNVAAILFSSQGTRHGQISVGQGTLGNDGFMAFTIRSDASGFLEAARFDENYNLIVKNAAKGINFTANTPAAGMTSQLLNWYEAGTWTPTITSGAGSITSYSSGGFYTRVGRSVSITGYFSLTNAGTASGACNIAGLPFTTNSTARQIGTSREDAVTGGTYQFFVLAGSTSAALVNIVWTSGFQYNFTIVYQTA
jgi:hypothetical protein